MNGKCIVSQLCCFGKHQRLLFKKEDTDCNSNEHELHQDNKSNDKFHYKVESFDSIRFNMFLYVGEIESNLQNFILFSFDFH